MMKRELEYFEISGEYGGNQEYFAERMMWLGGCGAETACDLSIYFSLCKKEELAGGPDLYPFDIANLCREDYVKFGTIMKPYLSPRMTGINRLDIYTEGFGKYLSDIGENRLQMEEFAGENPTELAKTRIKESIDRGFPIAVLTLKHKDKEFDDFYWHWYILNGYDESGDLGEDGEFLVKAVSYGEYVWLDFDRLWETGYSEKGGLVFFDIKKV